MSFLSSLRIGPALGAIAGYVGSFAVFAAGLAFIVWGAWTLAPAAGMIVAGLALAGVALAYELRPASRARRGLEDDL